MTDIASARQALLARIRDGSGTATADERRAAFAGTGPAGAAALLAKVATDAVRVTDADLAAARAAGFSEDQLFELIVAAAVGAADRQYDNARAALAAARKG